MNEIGIRCGYFLSMRGGRADVETDIFVGIKDGRISEIVPWNESMRMQARDFIDASEAAVLPGLVNAHTHLPMSLFRGLEDDSPFHRWLFERILPLESALVSADFVRTGTELSALECIRFGTTTVADMYMFASTVADVLDRAGLRGWVSQVWTKVPLPEDSTLGTDKRKLFEELLERLSGHARLTASLGPHAPYTCDDEIYRTVAKLSEKHSAPVQTHLCETAFEVEQSIKEYGKTPVERLQGLGVLTPRTLCAHCVHFSVADTDIFKNAGSAVAYNPDSNLKLSAGIAPIVRYRKAGIPVALGTDGAASNNDLSLFGAMDTGVKLQKLAAHDNTAMTAADALIAATWEGARAMGMLEKIGSLEVGKHADLIIVGLNYPHMQPIHDIRSQLVYAATGMEVETVLVHGRVLMRDKQFQTLDQEKILTEAAHWRKKISTAIAKLG